MQAMLDRANPLFDLAHISEFPAALLAPGASLVEAAQESGIAATTAEAQFLDSWPAGLKEVIRAGLLSAVTRGIRATMAWAPAYDYEVSVWDTPGTEQSPGGMTIFLRSPYQQITLT
jgi:hypothetical protein